MADQIIIRLAQQKDIPSIYELSRSMYNEDVFPYSYFVFALELYTDTYLVAEKNEECVGFLSAVQPFYTPYEFWEIGFALQSGQSDKAEIASALLDEMKKILQGKKAQRFRMNMPPDDPMYYILLELGYKSSYLKKDIFGPGIDRYEFEIMGL